VQKDAARATAEHAEYTETGRENAFRSFPRISRFKPYRDWLLRKDALEFVKDLQDEPFVGK